jgi:hypothetical protein
MQSSPLESNAKRKNTRGRVIRVAPAILITCFFNHCVHREHAKVRGCTKRALLNAEAQNFLIRHPLRLLNMGECT